MTRPDLDQLVDCPAFHKNPTTLRDVIQRVRDAWNKPDAIIALRLIRWSDQLPTVDEAWPVT